MRGVTLAGKCEAGSRSRKRSTATISRDEPGVVLEHAPVADVEQPLDPGELAVERRPDQQVRVELGDVAGVRVAGEELGVERRAVGVLAGHGAAAYGPHVANAAEDAAQIRIARPTDRLDEVVAFYRDGLGLAELGGFARPRRLHRA